MYQNDNGEQVAVFQDEEDSVECSPTYAIIRSRLRNDAEWFFYDVGRDGTVDAKVYLADHLVRNTSWYDRDAKKVVYGERGLVDLPLSPIEQRLADQEALGYVDIMKKFEGERPLANAERTAFSTREVTITREGTMYTLRFGGTMYGEMTQPHMLSEEEIQVLNGDFGKKLNMFYSSLLFRKSEEEAEEKRQDINAPTVTSFYYFPTIIS